MCDLVDAKDVPRMALAALGAGPGSRGSRVPAVKTSRRSKPRQPLKVKTALFLAAPDQPQYKARIGLAHGTPSVRKIAAFGRADPKPRDNMIGLVLITQAGLAGRVPGGARAVVGPQEQIETLWIGPRTTWSAAQGNIEAVGASKPAPA